MAHHSQGSKDDIGWHALKETRSVVTIRGRPMLCIATMWFEALMRMVTANAEKLFAP